MQTFGMQPDLVAPRGVMVHGWAEKPGLHTRARASTHALVRAWAYLHARMRACGQFSGQLPTLEVSAAHGSDAGASADLEGLYVWAATALVSLERHAHMHTQYAHTHARMHARTLVSLERLGPTCPVD